MGPRPLDFDESLVREAPTFIKWTKLQPGETLSYACRRFEKGAANDEERLMRRIMIARRNNLKDHATLKEARATEAKKRGVIPPGKKKNADDGAKDAEQQSVAGEGIRSDLPAGECPPSPSNPSGTKRRRVAGTAQPTDEEVLMEMDVPAVEATRSYRKWCALPEGAAFTYNQTYIRGKDDHDWLLRKNIWRRMRYRRENQLKVVEMKGELGSGGSDSANWTACKGGAPRYKARVNHAAAARVAEASGYAGTEQASRYAAVSRVETNGGPPPVPREEEEHDLVSRAVVDAAAAAAMQVEAFEPGIDADAVAALGANDPIVTSALDAAAQLAAAAVADAPGAAAAGQGGSKDAAEMSVIQV